MTSDQVFLLPLIGASVWIARRWTIDCRAAVDGRPNEPAIPGSTPISVRAVAIAAFGALFVLAMETTGEHVFDLSAQQSKVTALCKLYSIFSAPEIEEVLFRGHLVIEERGRKALGGGVVGASLPFALLPHPFLWEWNAGNRAVQFGPGSAPP